MVYAGVFLQGGGFESCAGGGWLQGFHFEVKDILHGEPVICTMSPDLPHQFSSNSHGMLSAIRVL
jgi:hypothetical protein